MNRVPAKCVVPGGTGNEGQSPSSARSSPGPSGEEPLVSVLIPCYNAEPWITQCLESALAQTYPRIEVVVVDDGSTDRSAQVVRSFGERVRFETGPHTGGNHARNRLLALARGRWLQYLDADDCLLPGKIAGQMGFLRRRGYDLDVVYSPILIRDESSRSEALLAMESGGDMATQFIRWGPLNTNGLLWRREAVVGVGGWLEGQSCCQEHELLLRLMTAECRAGLWNEAGVVYRRHSGGSVSSRDPLRVLQTQMALLERFERFLAQKGRLTPAHVEALAVARMEAARTAYPRDRRLARELFRQARTGSAGFVRATPALPWRFQLAARLFGYDGAERLAALCRGARRLSA